MLVKKSFKRLHRWRYSPTAAYGNNEVHLHPYKKRRITVAEALAIQSLPKKYELPQSMTKSEMFKTVGNGVPYLLSKGLASGIKKIYNEYNKGCENLSMSYSLEIIKKRYTNPNSKAVLFTTYCSFR